jgi:hypothetical protein
VLSIPARLREVLGAIFPETIQTLMDLFSPLLPHGQSVKRLTGAQVRGRAEPRPEEIMYNQVADKSAAFNMGLKSSKNRRVKHETANSTT